MKKTLSVLLALVLVLSLLSGCGSTAQESSNNPAPAQSEETAAADTKAEAAPAASEDDEDDGTPVEPDEINFYLSVWGQYTGFDQVAEEFSRITEEKANVKVDL